MFAVFKNDIDDLRGGCDHECWGCVGLCSNGARLGWVGVIAVR